MKDLFFEKEVGVTKGQGCMFDFFKEKIGNIFGIQQRDF